MESPLFQSMFYDQKTMDEVIQRIEAQAGTMFDARRIAIAVEYVRRFGLNRGPCVEIGSLDHLVARILWSFFPDATVASTSNDLRNEPLPFIDGAVNSVTCLEVLEHLSDVPYREATTLNGVLFFLEELYRVLAVSGRALITTPNAASIWALQRILLGEHPAMYDWHFREFTIPELRQLCEYVGFEVIVQNTEFVWHLWDFTPIVSFMTACGYDATSRGDDQFLVVQKPKMRVRKPHSLNLPT
jgi:SAM-dependent methyltransferase